ncbi:MAG: ribonuclease P protein component [Gammaproteobacteria bacterium]|nr:ribonuclease P protein component [Gammaproteobacteria bacterium]
MTNRHRLTAAYRITKAADFSQIFSGARRLRARHFDFLYRTSETLTPRLGIAVSKRMVPRAVDRNRIKRIIRESFRLHVQPAVVPLDVVVYVKPSARTTPNQVLFVSLIEFWTQPQESARPAQLAHD